MKRLLFGLIALAGCSRTPILADQPDMVTPTDMTIVRDLAVQPKSCGEAVLCVFGCGQDPQCLPMCIQGVDGQTIGQVVGLGICAAQGCFLGRGDAGMLDMFGLLRCIAENCPDQLDACEGLPFGGF